MVVVLTPHCMPDVVMYLLFGSAVGLGNASLTTHGKFNTLRSVSNCLFCVTRLSDIYSDKVMAWTPEWKPTPMTV